MQPTWSREARPGRRPAVRLVLREPRPGRVLAVACWCGLLLSWVWGAAAVRLAERPPIALLPGPAERHVVVRPGLHALRLVIKNAGPVAVRITAVQLTAGPGVVSRDALVEAREPGPSLVRGPAPQAAPAASEGPAGDPSDTPAVAVISGGVNGPAAPLRPGGLALRSGQTAVVWVPLEVGPDAVHVISRIGLDLRVLGLSMHQVLRDFGYVQIATDPDAPPGGP